MSVLIKGIHIPTGCAVCFYNRDSMCLLLPGSGYDETNGAQRRENCPIVELPDHGDLIDGEVLREKAHKLPNGYNHGYFHKCVDELFDFAPVVIPAERSEE